MSPKINIGLTVLFVLIFALGANVSTAQAQDLECANVYGGVYNSSPVATCTIPCPGGGSVSSTNYEWTGSAYVWYFPPCASHVLRCAAINLPRAITPSIAQPISYKGDIAQSSAVMRIPGWDTDLPLAGMFYDFGAKTWSGYMNTSSLPPGDYSNVRLVLWDKYGAHKVCNIGGLEVLGG